MKKWPIKTGIVTMVLYLMIFGNTLSASAQEGERVLGLPEHELGDQILGMDAGLLIPLFFQDFAGNTADTNLSLGGLASLQWNTYLSPFFRLGLELGGSFNLSPQGRSLLMMPVIAKATFVFNVSRFEFPVFFGAGVNLVRYRDWSQVDFIMKAGAGGFWRYDANWSFGLHMSWWWDFQPTTRYQPPEQARMAHYLEITPALLYHF